MALIHKYCIQGKIAEVTDLLRRDKNCVNSVSEAQYTPLLCAVAEGWQDIVKLLLDHNANIYAKDRSDYNCLHMAFIKAASQSTKPEKRESFFTIIEMILQKEAILRRGLTAIQYKPLLETVNSLGLKPLDCIHDGVEKQRILEKIEGCSCITDAYDPEESNSLRHRSSNPSLASNPQRASVSSGAGRQQPESPYPFVATLLSLSGYLFHRAGQQTPKLEENRPLLNAATPSDPKVKVS